MNSPHPILKNETTRELFLALLGVALYLSGFFVFLTPLPFCAIFYQWYEPQGKPWTKDSVASHGVLTKQGSSPEPTSVGDKNIDRALRKFILPFCFFLLLMYLFVVPSLYSFYQLHPQWSWLLVVPGMDLLHFASLRAVTFYGLAYFLFFVGCAFTMCKALKSLHQWVTHIQFGVLSLFVASIILVAGYAFFVGVSPNTFLHTYFERAIQDFIEIQKNNNASIEQLTFLDENKILFLKYSVLLSPAFIFCMMLFVFVLNLIVAQKFFHSYFIEIKKIRFNSWLVPFYWVWVVIVSISLLLLNSYLLKSVLLETLSINILLALSFVYYLNGFSIISYFLGAKSVRPIMRYMIYIFILLLFQSIGLFIASLGFFDSWFDIRKKIEASTFGDKSS